MNAEELIQNAIGANGFTTDETSAGLINPSYWNKQLMAYLTKSLVVANKAKVFNDILGQDGSSFKVTIDATPTAAAAVAETDDVTASVFETVTQVTFTPSEYAKAYQLSDKEARRGFFNVMENMTKKIGYAFALLQDTTAVSLLQTSAGNSIIANGAATSAASTDTLDYDDIVNACKEIRADLMVPRFLFVSPGGFAQLAKAAQFSYVEHAGTDETLRTGSIGKIYGLTVYETTQIAPSSNQTKAIVLGVDQLGEPVFGIGNKAMPEIRMQRFELGRYTDIVGVCEWDMQMLRVNGVCKILHYE
jgi:N4-gp56 family major capsid protein